MSKYGHPDFPSDEVDLAKSSNFDNSHPSAGDQIKPSEPVTEPAGPGISDGLGEEELEIPKFLLKNSTADAAAFEEDKFANRSMKMVQDAVRTLAQVEPDVEPEAAMVAPHAASQQNSSGGSWKIPMTFVALAIGIGGYFAYQNGNLDAIASFAQKRVVQTALNENGNRESDDNINITTEKMAGKVDAEAPKPAVTETTIPKIVNPVVKLDGDQYDSLKARLGGETVIPSSSTDNVETASLKRQQVAALVAEQAPPKPKSTRSLDKVNEAARELEAEVSKPETETIKPVAIQPVTVKPAQPAVQLAQASTSAEDKLKLLTNNVVNQLNKLKQFEDNPETAEIPETQDLRNSINQLVQQATSQNLDSSAIEGLLQEALENSGAVPQALARADGKLDTRLLLMSVLSQVDSSQVKSSDTDYLAALDDEGSSTVVATSLADAPAASSLDNARIVTTNGKKTIKVVVGDTLSKIAFAVYGDALTYTRIFKANRSRLKNPNLLKVGMVLKLP